MKARSLEVYKQYWEAQQKYDYFIVGLSLALFAYIGKNFTTHPLGINSSTIELLAIISISISVASGLLRFEDLLLVKANNYRKIDNLEKKEKLTEALLKKEPLQDTVTGEFFDPEKAMIQIEAIDIANTEIESLLAKHLKRCEVRFKIRNWTLMIGVFLLAVSKIFESIIKTIMV